MKTCRSHVGTLRVAVLLVPFFLCAGPECAAQLHWTELGPAPITTGPYSGRVAAVVASPTDQNLYFAAGADGGVWRTDNGGTSWTPLTDQLPVTAIGALALDPTREKTIYAGSGEGNFANHSRYGSGLYKSTDGGSSWQVLAPQTFGGRCFSRIVVDPSNPATLYASITTAGGFPAVSAARGHPGAGGPLGIFKSTDAGLTFAHLTNGIPGNLSATDVTLDPVDPRIVYAAIGHIFGSPQNGIYKSTNAGASFVKLSGGGLPGGTAGRITLAAAPSRAGRVYATFVNPADAAGDGATTLGVVRTDDFGATWTPLSAAGSYHATYGWYLCTAIVHPTNPDIVFLGGFTVLRSTNAGVSFVDRTAPHVDNHAFAWDAAGRLLCGNDGGLHRSANQGDAWTALNSGLGTIQYYAGISLHPSNSDVMYGGLQDNGSNRRGAGNTWTQVLGGDGGYTGISSDGNTVFAEYQGTGSLFRSTGGGGFVAAGSGLSGRNCFLPPYELDPTNSARLVYGTERVFLSTNSGGSWAPISPDLTGGSGAIRGIAFAPGDPRFIYVATNDGRIQVTEDGGSNWNLRRSGVPGWSRVTRPFAVHPSDPRRAYLAVGQFGTDQLLYTADAGRTWFPADGNLPDVPVHCVALDTRVDPPIVFLGTDRGVWRTLDHYSWDRLGDNFPNAPVIDLRVELGRNRVVAATQGRGLWSVRLLGTKEVESAPVLR